MTWQEALVQIGTRTAEAYEYAVWYDNVRRLALPVLVFGGASILAILLIVLVGRICGAPED